MATQTKSTRTKQEIVDADERACDEIERKHLTCPKCGKKMIRLNQDASWGCPWGLDHSRVIQNETLRGYIKAHVVYDGTPDKYRTVVERDKRTKQVVSQERKFVCGGKDVQLSRIIKALETRCGWHKPRWASFYQAFLTQAIGRYGGNKPCVIRIGRWYVTYGHSQIAMVREHLRWRTKEITISNDGEKEEVRIAYSAFDHDGSIERKIVEAGITIL